MNNLDLIAKKAEEVVGELVHTLEIAGEELKLYNAGIEQGKIRFGLFARDLLLSAFITGDESFLEDAVKFGLLTQGTGKDPETGEEPGRVIHEYETVKMRGLITKYNAADTTQLTLVGLGSLLDGEDDKFYKKPQIKGAIERSIEYLLNHVDRGLFWENPSFCGNDRYALRSTYWKDDKLPSRENPDYPVAYTLVQAQTVAALRAASDLTAKLDLKFDSENLIDTADRVSSSIFSLLWDDLTQYPVIALDESGPISGISSDGLHMLYYLKREDVPGARLEKIFNGANRLVTPYGFRTYASDQVEYAPGSYHLGSIWPFEQYFIAAGGKSFENDQILEIGSRSIKALEEYGFYELFGWDGDELTPLGCEKQLWSACFPLGLKRLVDR